MTEQEMQFELMKSQEEVNKLRQEVASMNKECEYWQQVRIQAAVNITCQLSEHWIGAGYSESQIAKQAVTLADALVVELQTKGWQDRN